MRQAAGRKPVLNQFVQWISANMNKMPAADKATRSERSLFYLIFLINACFRER